MLDGAFDAGVLVDATGIVVHSNGAARDLFKAMDDPLEGNWIEAFRLLHEVPAEDQVKDFLTVIIAQHRREPPPDWQGVIELPGK